MNTISRSHYILWTVAIFFVCALVWAKYATLDEVTVIEGKIIPARKIQVIQHLEGGIIKKISVREGETVQKGQTLMVLDDTRFSTEYKEHNLKLLELRIRILRLSAEVNKKPFTPGNTLKKEAPELVETETKLYKSRQAELNTLKKRYSLIKKEIELNKPLVKGGIVSEVELLRLEQRLGEVDGEIQKIRSQTLNELNQNEAELSRLQQSTIHAKDKLERTALKAPVHGIIKQIHVSTVGAVVQPGVALMEIVPLEDTLRVEGRIRPSDIGFIHPGQKAIVKVSAYDYAIYGGLEGQVEHISADTSSDEEGKSYYEVWIRTNKAYLGTKANPLLIIPGMQASADILTGKKTVLEYLLKPILRAQQKALRER